MEPPARPATIRDAADRVGLSQQTIRRRIADGTLRSWRLGPRALRVDLDDVDRLYRPAAS